MSSNVDDTVEINGMAPDQLPAETEASNPEETSNAERPAAEGSAVREEATSETAPVAEPDAEEMDHSEMSAAAEPQREREESADHDGADADADDAPMEDTSADVATESDTAPEEAVDAEADIEGELPAPADGEFEEDGRADQALDFVVDVLTTMGMDCTVDLMENDENDPPSDIRIEITGKDADRLIGKKGQTLAAIQFLTNRVVNRPNKPRRHILIDADGYRARREHALSTMAQRLGKQAIEEGKIITFEPMTAQDRRVVHLALVKLPGVVTKSEGKGSTRRVQIIPVRE